MNIIRATFILLFAFSASNAFAEPRSPTEIVRALVSSAIGPNSTDHQMQSAERSFMTEDLYRIARQNGSNVITYTQDTTDAVIDVIKVKGTTVAVTFLVTGSGTRYTHDYILVEQKGRLKVNDIIYHFPRGAESFSLRKAPKEEHHCVQRPHSIIQDCD